MTENRVATLKDVAALAGFDQGELITIPSLPEVTDWEAYEAARQNLIPKLSLSRPAARYRVALNQSRNFGDVDDNRPNAGLAYFRLADESEVWTGTPL